MLPFLAVAGYVAWIGFGVSGVDSAGACRSLLPVPLLTAVSYALGDL